MKTILITGVLSLMLAVPALADVTYETETKMSGMMKMFGGGGQESVVQISGDKMRTESDDHVQIIDLGTEEIYDLDKKKKTYTVMTFQEMKNEMKEGMASANESMEKGDEGSNASARADFKVSDTGKTENIKGYPCQQYLMEMEVDIEDTKNQQEGSLSTLLEMWLTKEAPGIDEVNAFNRKMAEKLGTAELGRQMTSGKNEQANNMAINMREMADEMKKMDGFPIRSVMYFGSPEAAKQEALGSGGEEKEEEKGGGFGGFMKKMKIPGAGGGAGGGVMMKMTTEIDKIETKAIDPSVFTVPDNYKQVTR